MNSMVNPKISIIIPVYNTRKYLRRCLASVCGQLLKEIEIICINDGSTDGSLEILRDHEVSDSRIAVIDQKNKGAASARNKGLQTASAPYIGFVDSDDFIAPDMYEKMYNAMIMNDVDFVECGAEPIFTYAFNNKDELRDYFSTGNLTGIVREPDVFINTSGALWKNLFKKELIIKYHLVFPDGFNTNEDTLFIISYKSLVQSGFYLPENLYIYFCYEDSIMGKLYMKKQGKRITEKLAIIKLFYLFLNSHGIFERWKSFFEDFFEQWINSFYQYAEPGIIQSYAIDMICDLLKIEDICRLLEKRNWIFLLFTKTKNIKLLKIYSFYLSNRNIFRKLCKYMLPYGTVRMIQKYKQRKRKYQ